MANCAIIMGASGTGKSTSIKGLDPKSTLIVNVLGKRLPFKGSNVNYNKENKNLFQLDDFDDINNLLKSIEKGAPQIKNVIIDD